MEELVTAVLAAPIANLFIVAGLAFCGIAIVGNISGKVEPGKVGRIASGVFGLILLVTGFGMHVVTVPIATPTPTPTDDLGAPIIEFDITPFGVFPKEIIDGQSVTIKWKVSNAESAVLEPFGSVEIDKPGQRTDTPHQTRIYTLTAYQKDKSKSPKITSIEVFVRPSPPTPDVRSTAEVIASQTAAAQQTTQAAAATTQTAQAARLTATSIAATQAAQAAQLTATSIAATQAAQAARLTATSIAATQAAQAARLTATSIAATRTAQASVPIQQSPNNGAVLSIYPRTTTLRWLPVAGATGYIVDIQYCQAGVTNCVSYNPVNVTTTSYTFNFVGAQPGRWRVRAVFSGGRQGNPSDWWVFTYTR